MVDTLPVYIQIHDAIKKKIETNYWKIGDRLPSERELSTQFGVSRMTLRQAIQTLADEGILERKIGSGTYVARRKVQEKMTGTTSFTEIMLSQGREPSSRAVSYFFTSPSSSEMDKLQLTKDDIILRMERIRLADDIPICFEVASIPEKLIREYSKSEITSSLYRTLEEKGAEKNWWCKSNYFSNDCIRKNCGLLRYQKRRCDFTYASSFFPIRWTAF